MKNAQRITELTDGNKSELLRALQKDTLCQHFSAVPVEADLLNGEIVTVTNEGTDYLYIKVNGTLRSVALS